MTVVEVSTAVLDKVTVRLRDPVARWRLSSPSAVLQRECQLVQQLRPRVKTQLELPSTALTGLALLLPILSPGLLTLLQLYYLLNVVLLEVSQRGRHRDCGHHEELLLMLLTPLSTEGLTKKRCKISLRE